jgi:ATP-dependent Clp protease ATP-binding subunit ClpC
LVVELSVTEARRLIDGYVVSEHLLLDVTRNGSVIAAGVLESFGVTCQRLDAATTRLLTDR